MQVKLTTESEARFKRTLRAIARETNKSLLDLLRQAAVFYATSARKATPGPWYGVSKRSQRLRPVTPLTMKESMRLREPGKPIPRVLVSAWVGKQPTKTEKLIPAASSKSDIRKIKYRGAGQVSWTNMMRKLFKKPPTNTFDFTQTPRFYTHGATVLVSVPQADYAFIETENNLSYLSKIAPGINQRSMQAAQNRFQAVWSKKLGDVVKKEWR